MAEKDCNSLAELNDFLAKNGTSLVDFHATWCGPCKAIAPYVHEQCKAHGVPLAKVDVDVAADAAQKYNIEAMPTFHVLDKNGKTIAQVTGGGKANVDKMISAAKGK